MKLYFSKFIILTFLFVIAIPAYGENIKVTPKWNINDHFQYQIEIDEGFPINFSEDEKVTKYIFMFSLSVKEKTRNFWTLEWQYLPVENTIRNCPFKTTCYSYIDEIKQQLLIDYTVTSDGIYYSCNNGPAMQSQIETIFNEFAKENEPYKNFDEQTLQILRESIQTDDSLISELFEFHSIYGNEIEANRFAKGSPINETINRVTNDYNVNTTSNVSTLTIALDYSIMKKPRSGKSKYISPVIQTTYHYKWLLSKNSMTINEMNKEVEFFLSDNKKRRYNLYIKLVSSKKP